MAYFDDYQGLYAQIDKVNQQASKELAKFSKLVDEIREDSEGELFGVNMKMPKDKGSQFKVLLRIMEKMFKAEITPQKVKEIIEKVDK